MENQQIVYPFDEHGRSPALQRFYVAKKYMNSCCFEEALAFFAASADEMPHFKTYELMGECLVRQGKHKQAVLYLAAATALNRGPRAPSLLGDALLCAGLHSEAACAATEALSRDPKNALALSVKQATSKYVQEGQIDNYDV